MIKIQMNVCNILKELVQGEVEGEEGRKEGRRERGKERKRKGREEGGREERREEKREEVVVIRHMSSRKLGQVCCLGHDPLGCAIPAAAVIVHFNEMFSVC